MKNNLNQSHVSLGGGLENTSNQSQVSQKVIDILEYQGVENIDFKVFQTIAVPIVKGKNYKISTSELNGCTAGYILFKNSKGVAFVIATHFPPIDGMLEKQKEKMNDLIAKNMPYLKDILEVEICYILETKKHDVSVLSLSSFMEQKMSVLSNNIISYYDVKDKARAEGEDIGQLKLEIFANGKFQLFHEGKILTKNQ